MKKIKHLIIIIAFIAAISIMAVRTIASEPASNSVVVSNVENVTLNQAATAIEERAFRGCENSSSVLEGNPNRGRRSSSNTPNNSQGSDAGRNL